MSVKFRDEDNESPDPYKDLEPYEDKKFMEWLEDNPRIPVYQIKTIYMTWKAQKQRNKNGSKKRD